MSTTKGSVKSALLAQISARLEGELVAARQAAKVAYDAATHTESKAENKYDTRGLEASYLAGAQKEREDALEAGLLLLRGLRVEDFEDDAPVKPLALVELEHAGQTQLYFVAPFGGGYVLESEGQMVHVVTLKSPLGKALLGKRSGDIASVHTPQGVKDYEVLGVW